MRILLDTHILVWFHTRDEALSQKAWDILLDPDNEIFYSSINIWETQMKFLKHADDINFSGDELNDLSIKAGLQSLPVKPNHCIELNFSNLGVFSPKQPRLVFDQIFGKVFCN